MSKTTPGLFTPSHSPFGLVLFSSPKFTVPAPMRYRLFAKKMLFTAEAKRKRGRAKEEEERKCLRDRFAGTANIVRRGREGGPSKGFAT